MKKTITYLATFLLAFLLLYNNAAAQRSVQSEKLYGIVKDSLTHEALELITIKLKTAKDSLLKTAISKADGKFELDNIRALKYHLVLISIGYEVKVIDINLADKKMADIGVIYLTKQTKNLSEVVINGYRPIFQHKADRIIYDMQADPESKVNSVLSMIHKIPYLSVDANNNVMMKGNASFKVLLNGKPSGMLTNNLTEVLRSMPASSILRIEVITIPPSKYDAEGMAGVINIITDRKINDGYKGSLNAHEDFPAGGPGVGGSFTAQQGKFGINGYGGASTYNNPQTNYINSRTTTDTNATALKQNGYNKSNSKNGYLGMELSYQIDTLNLLSGNFNINGNRYNGSSYQTSTLNDNTGLLQGYNLNNTNNGNRSGLDAAINYQLGFKSNKNTLLTFSYQYSAFSSSSYNDIGISDPFNYTTPDYTQTDDEHSIEQTVQVDYTQPISKVNMETGVKAILRNSNSNSGYNSLDSVSNLFEADPAMGNVFRYTQDVFGVYNSYQFSIKKWNFSAGLRAEETYVDANFISTGTNTVQNYFNVVPSIAVNKSFGNNNLSFGFSQRIRRPSIYRLNPFVDRSNPDFISSGNPKLQPVVMNNIQLGYSNGGGKRVSIFLGVDGTFFNNLELPTTFFNPATQITTTTYENAAKGGGTGLNFNLNYSPEKVYNLSVNGNAMYFFIKGTGNIAADKVDMLAGHVSFSNSFKFNAGWSSNINFDYYSKAPQSIQVISNAFFTSSLSVNKELIKNKLFLSVLVNNPFTKFRNSITETTAPDFIQTGNNQIYFRSFSFSINYNFGKLKSDIKKNRKVINNDDVSNGGGI